MAPDRAARARRLALAAGLAVGLAVGLSAGCGDRERPRPPEEAAEAAGGDASPAPEPPPSARAEAPLALGDGVEALLRLARAIPPGADLARVRRTLPGVGEPGAEGGGGLQPTGPLSEATVPAEALGRRARIELNFRHDTLYSLYASIDSLPCPRADSLYAALRRGLSRRLGEAREEEGREPGYRSRTSFWPPDPGAEPGAGAIPAPAFVATLGIQGGVCRLGWGYQESPAR